MKCCFSPVPRPPLRPCTKPPARTVHHAPFQEFAYVLVPVSARSCMLVQEASGTDWFARHACRLQEARLRGFCLTLHAPASHMQTETFPGAPTVSLHNISYTGRKGGNKGYGAFLQMPHTLGPKPGLVACQVSASKFGTVYHCQVPNPSRYLPAPWARCTVRLATERKHDMQTCAKGPDL